MTTPFNKGFHITDKEVALILHKALQSPVSVKTKKRNLNHDDKKGIELLNSKLIKVNT